MTNMTNTDESTTTNPDEYNGWVNRETAMVNLHLSNDEKLYHTSLRLCNGDDVSVYVAADQLKDFVESAVEAVYFAPAESAEWARMLAADVGSLWRVDWVAVAEPFREES